MKPEEVFGIFVRALGIWELAMSLEGMAGITAGFAAFVAVVLKGAVGGILVFNAEAIVQAAYRTVWREG